MPTARRPRLRVIKALSAQPATCAALGHFLEYAFVNQIEELRNHGENCDLAFVERAQQFCSVQRLQVNHAAPFTSGSRRFAICEST